MTVAPVGARVSLRCGGKVGDDRHASTVPVAVSVVAEIADIDRFVADATPSTPVVGGITHPRWGYRPFADGTLTVRDDGGVRRFVVSATVRGGGRAPGARSGMDAGPRPAAVGGTRPGWRWRVQGHRIPEGARPVWERPGSAPPMPSGPCWPSSPPGPTACASASTPPGRWWRSCDADPATGAPPAGCHTPSAGWGRIRNPLGSIPRFRRGPLAPAEPTHSRGMRGSDR